MRDNRLALLYLRYEGWFMPRGLPPAAMFGVWPSLCHGVLYPLDKGLKDVCLTAFAEHVRKVSLIS